MIQVSSNIQEYSLFVLLLLKESIYILNLINKTMIHNYLKNHRIQRIKLKNIAQPQIYQPVTQRNNVFIRIKKNSSIISQTNNIEQQMNHIRPHKQRNLMSRSVDLSKKKLSIISKQSRQSYGRSSSHQNFSSKYIDKSISQIKKPMKQHIFANSNAPLALTSNTISGTTLGSLSTAKILDEYQKKRFNQQQKAHHFLQQLTKPNKQQEIDDQYQIDMLMEQKSITFSIRNGSKSLSISQSQQNVCKLLENRLTDRDYIDFNVKLFEKKNVNQKRYFQRYHNILKKQRQQLS